MVTGQANTEFVDHNPVIALKDVDGDDVTPYCPDAASHGPEGPRSVGKLDSDQVVRHPLRLWRHCVGTISCRLRVWTRRRRYLTRRVCPRRRLLPTGVLIDVLLAG